MKTEQFDFSGSDTFQWGDNKSDEVLIDGINIGDGKLYFDLDPSSKKRLCYFYVDTEKFVSLSDIRDGKKGNRYYLRYLGNKVVL